MVSKFKNSNDAKASNNGFFFCPLWRLFLHQILCNSLQIKSHLTNWLCFEEYNYSTFTRKGLYTYQLTVFEYLK